LVGFLYGEVYGLVGFLYDGMNCLVGSLNVGRLKDIKLVFEEYGFSVDVALGLFRYDNGIHREIIEQVIKKGS